jgi:hypothetical protein
VFALVLVGGGLAFGFAKSSDGGEDPPTTAENATPAVAAPVAEPEPEPEPEPAAESGEGDTPTPPPDEKAKIAFTVNTGDVAAIVYDQKTDTELGKTNEPISLDSSTDELEFYVSAEGYEQATGKVLPDKDQSLTVELVPVPEEPKGTKKRAGKKRRGKKQTKKATKATETKATPTVGKTDTPPAKKTTTEPKPKKSSTSNPDLKDPFAG